MQLDPPLKLAHRFPVSATVALASIVLTVLLMFGTNLDFLIAERGTFVRAPWTLVTSTFVHLGLIHLLFNLSWWWPFACRMEYAWGKARLIGILLLFAIISGAAQIAFSGTGVGLSGVVYGIFALIAVVHHTHPIFKGLVTRNTIWMFAGFFVLFIILTILDILPVGNVAHGAGAAAGYLLGRCMVATPRTRPRWIASLVAVGTIAVAGNFVTIPYITTRDSLRENIARGSAAYHNGDYKEAARHLELARRADPQDPRIAFALALALHRQNLEAEALPLYIEAVKKDQSLRGELAPVIASLINQQAAHAAEVGDLDAAAELAHQAIEWQPDDEYAQELLMYIRKKISNSSTPAPTPK